MSIKNYLKSQKDLLTFVNDKWIKPIVDSLIAPNSADATNANNINHQTTTYTSSEEDCQEISKFNYHQEEAKM